MKYVSAKGEVLYSIDPKIVNTLNNTVRNKCPYCGHTTIKSVKIEYILCDYCWNKYKNNSKAYKLKKIKEMLKSEIERKRIL